MCHSVRLTVELGGCTQAKQWCWTQGQWPKKSAASLLHVLTNAERSAELKDLGAEPLVTGHAQVSKAPKMNCKTLESMQVMQELPCHTERGQTVPVAEEGCAQKRETSSKKPKEQRF